jgi:hypothetical protein
MIKITSEQIDRISLILHNVPNGLERAIKSVIPRAQSTAKAESLRQIKKVYHIGDSGVRDRQKDAIKLRTTNEHDAIIGELWYSNRKIPLYRFNVSPKEPTKTKDRLIPVNFGMDSDKWRMVNPSAPVYASQFRNNPRKHIKNTFIAKMSNGHTGIFERKGDDRYPLREVMGSSTAQMAKNSIVLEEVYKVAQETAEKRVEHEISRILNNYGGRS